MPQQAVIAKEANSEGKEKEIKRKIESEIERKRRKLIAPRSALFGHRERTKRQRRHRGNEIGPSEKLHSRALRNDTVIPRYRHIVVWNCSFRRLRNALCPPRSDDIARFLSPARCDATRHVTRRVDHENRVTEKLFLWSRWSLFQTM